MLIVSPIGSATEIAIKEVSNVPESSGRIPKCFSVNRGVHWVSVKKSTMETSLKNCTASIESTIIIPTVTKIVIKALESSDFSIMSSFTFRIVAFLYK